MTLIDAGKLTVNHITLGSNGKINSADDYHYIQISQPTDTLIFKNMGQSHLILE
jgi:hypothetical protein